MMLVKTWLRASGQTKGLRALKGGCKLPSCFNEAQVGWQDSHWHPRSAHHIRDTSEPLPVPCPSFGSFCYHYPPAELTELGLFALSWMQAFKKPVKLFPGIAVRLLPLLVHFI